MTPEAFAQINRNRIARGQQPLTYIESPGRRQAPLPPLVTAVKTSKSGASHLEEKFVRLWANIGGPTLEREFKFHPARKWRSDFVHHATRTLIEIEGGAFCGRHTKAKGFLNDAEKYFNCAEIGYSVIRLTANMINENYIVRTEKILRKRENELLGGGLDKEKPKGE